MGRAEPCTQYYGRPPLAGAAPAAGTRFQKRAASGSPGYCVHDNVRLEIASRKRIILKPRYLILDFGGVNGTIFGNR